MLCSCSDKNSSSASESSPAQTYPPFTASFLSIGKADFILLQTENHNVIIDCGEKDNGKEIAEYLEKKSVATVDYLIITHFDKDHVGGASKVLKTASVLNVIEPDYSEDSDEMDKYRKTLNEKNITPNVLKEQLSFTLDDVDFTVDPPQKDFYGEDNDNDFSIITTARHHNKTFLFTGDAMELRLSEIMDSAKCDFLKVPYHGREIANIGQFLDSASPEIAVICTSKKEVSESTLDALAERNILDYPTYTCDEITAVSDGNKITVTCS